MWSNDRPPFANDLEPPQGIRNGSNVRRRTVSPVLRAAPAVELEREDTYGERFARVHFWPHVDKSGGPRACWPWTGSINSEGYGYFAAHGKVILAHRYAVELVEGWLPWHVNACHKCNRRECCHADARHVYAGTVRENTDDRVAKFREVAWALAEESKL